MDSTFALDLGGVRQWISVRGRDARAPILLFLHGGPGTAQLTYSRTPQRPLEEDFLVVNWDQRGAGRSYRPGMPRASMTIERLVLDTVELIEELRVRLGRSRVYLVGHSWGSILGLLVAQRRPDLLHAYIGVGQVVNMARGEEASYEFTLQQARRRNNTLALRSLEWIGPPPYRSSLALGVQRGWLSRFGGSMHRGGLGGVMTKNLSLRDLRPLDLPRLAAGFLFSQRTLEPQMREVNLARDVPRVEVPVYLCEGRFDHLVPSSLAAEFAGELEAPSVELVWFEDSGHLPHVEEPQAFAALCRRVLGRHSRG